MVGEVSRFFEDFNCLSYELVTEKKEKKGEKDNACVCLYTWVLHYMKIEKSNGHKKKRGREKT